MCFKLSFINVFFYYLKLDIFCLLNPGKQQDLGFACIQGGKTLSSNQEKIGVNSLIVLFFSTRPIILAKGMISNNVFFKKQL